MWNRKEVIYLKDFSKSLIFLFVCIVFVIITMSLQDDSNSEKINEKVHSINGEVLDIESKSILSDTPFTWNTKEMRIYKFTYVLNGEEKVGWFRNKTFGDDWILDYQED